MKYLDDIKNKPAHERRTHALQMAGAIIAAVFVVWVATIGVRLATQDPAVAQGGGDGTSQTASVDQAALSNGQATLLVSTSTDYSDQQ